MTAVQIEERQARANVPFEVAKQIRELLNAAKKDYGAKDWVDDDVECTIQALVFED